MDVAKTGVRVDAPHALSQQNSIHRTQVIHKPGCEGRQELLSVSHNTQSCQQQRSVCSMFLHNLLQLCRRRLRAHRRLYGAAQPQVRYHNDMTVAATESLNSKRLRAFVLCLKSRLSVGPYRQWRSCFHDGAGVALYQVPLMTSYKVCSAMLHLMGYHACKLAAMVDFAIPFAVGYLLPSSNLGGESGAR